MSHKRSLTTGFLIASLGLAAGLGVFASPTIASAGDDCSKLKVDKVKAVCSKGGQKAVQKAMKAASKAAGMDCKDCHANQKDYAFKDEAKAREEFNAKMLSHFE
jgi:hypothetical protein